jgi:hypothetical protein
MNYNADALWRASLSKATSSLEFSKVSHGNAGKVGAGEEPAATVADPKPEC